MAKIWYGWETRDGSRQFIRWWYLPRPDGSTGDANGPYGSKADANG